MTRSVEDNGLVCTTCNQVTRPGGLCGCQKKSVYAVGWQFGAERGEERDVKAFDMWNAANVIRQRMAKRFGTTPAFISIVSMSVLS